MNLKALFNADATYVHTGEIGEKSASDIVAWLRNQRNCTELTIVFMTFGGSVGYAFALHDAIKLMSASMKINLVALGICQSSGVIIMSSVDVDRRYTGPNTSFMIHAVACNSGDIHVKCDPQSPGVEMLQAIKSSAGIDLTEAYRLQELMIEVLSQQTKLDADTIRTMLEKDTYFSAEVAAEYGLVGHIIGTEPDPVVEIEKPPLY